MANKPFTDDERRWIRKRQKRAASQDALCDMGNAIRDLKAAILAKIEPLMCPLAAALSRFLRCF